MESKIAAEYIWATMPRTHKYSSCQWIWVFLERHCLQGELRAPSPCTPKHCMGEPNGRLFGILSVPYQDRAPWVQHHHRKALLKAPVWVPVTVALMMQTYISPAVDKARLKSQGGNNSPGPIYRQTVSDPCIRQWQACIVLSTPRSTGLHTLNGQVALSCASVLPA